MSSLSVTVLVDNTTLTDRFFTGEPGLSLYLKAGFKKILFDCGYSGAFIRNAYKLGIDLLDLDYVVLSHGHVDHTGGLHELIRLFLEAKIEGHAHRIPTIVLHPDCLFPRTAGPAVEIGSPVPFEKLNSHFPVQVSRVPLWITDTIAFLGEIDRHIQFPQAASDLKRKIVRPSGIADDLLLDDTAIACRTPDGIVIVTGCSHSGICNILRTAKKVCGDDRIVDIIGGLHLLKPSEEELSGTVECLKKAGITTVHPCHCTSLAAKTALAQAVPVQETGVGLELTYG